MTTALLLAASGCQPKPTADPLFIPTATPGAARSPTPTDTPGPQLPWELQNIPACAGLAPLPEPLKFSWPNLDEAYRKLHNYTWGYYSCDLPPRQLEAFFHQQMPKPPLLWDEINSSDQMGGHLRLYFNRAQVIWVYIWMLPRSGGQTSFIVIAKSDPGEADTWECRLPAEWRLLMARGSFRLPGRGLGERVTGT